MWRNSVDMHSLHIFCRSALLRGLRCAAVDRSLSGHAASRQRMPNSSFVPIDRVAVATGLQLVDPSLREFLLRHLRPFRLALAMPLTRHHPNRWGNPMCKRRIDIRRHGVNYGELKNAGELGRWELAATPWTHRYATSAPWQCLNFLPEPQGHAALRATLPQVLGSLGSAAA
jgi:hypothetical protein